MNSKHLQHLYWRAGFGISPNELDRLTTLGRKEIVDNLIDESKQFIPLKIDINTLRNLTFQEVNKSTVFKREFIKKSREKLKVFNLEWVYRMSRSATLMRERMTLFWAGHFV